MGPAGDLPPLRRRPWACPAGAGAWGTALQGSGFTQASLRAALPPGVALSGVLPVDVRLEALAVTARAPLVLPPLPAPEHPDPRPQRLQAWTDGSCLRQGDPLLARAAWGLRLERPGAGPVDCSGAVDGVQTAQRAEVTAAVHAVIEAGRPVEVVTDSRYVRNGVAALRAGACHMEWSHSDLWALIAPHCRSGFLTARWVKAHLDAAAARASGVSAED